MNRTEPPSVVTNVIAIYFSTAAMLSIADRSHEAVSGCVCYVKIATLVKNEEADQLSNYVYEENSGKYMVDVKKIYELRQTCQCCSYYELGDDGKT